MRNRLLVIWILLAAIAIAPAFGKGRKQKPTPVPAYHQPVISSVTGNAITVSDKNTTRTLTITQFTEITVNGQRASVADLKPGMTVSVTLGTDPSRAARINATGVPGGGKKWDVRSDPWIGLVFNRDRNRKNAREWREWARKRLAADLPNSKSFRTKVDVRLSHLRWLAWFAGTSLLRCWTFDW
jgi:hypothetical protein